MANNYNGWEVIDEGYEPVTYATPSPMGGSSPNYGGWEVIDEGYEPVAPSWENEARAIKNKFIEGVTGLGDLAVTGGSKAIQGYLQLTGNADAYNQIKDYMPKWGQAADIANEGLKRFGILGEEKAQTFPGRVAGEIASFAPGGGGIAPTIGAGVASGLTKEVTDNPYIALAMSMLGGVTPQALSSTKSAIGNFAKNVLPSRIAATRFVEAAGGSPDEIIAQIGQALVKNADDPFLPTKTTAEITRNTGLAHLQKGTAKSGGEALTNMVGKQLEKRDELRKAAIASMAPDEAAGLSPYEAGGTLREKFYLPARKAAKVNTSKAFTTALDAAGDVPIPIAPVQAELAAAESAHFPTMFVKAGDKGEEIAQVATGSLSGELGSLAKDIKRAVEVQPLRTMQNLKSRVGSVKRAAAATQGADEVAKIAGQLEKSFINAEDAAIASGALSPEQGAMLRNARKLHAEQVDRFGKGSSKKILARTPEDDFRLSGERVIPEILRTEAGTIKFNQAVGKSQKAKELVRGQIRRTLEEMSPDAQKKYILSHKEQLKQIFPAKHLKVIQKTAQDIADEQFVGKALSRAMSGGSDTTPSIASYIKTMLMTKTPVIKQLVAVAEHMSINPQELANRAIMKAALDPKEAIKLLRSPTKKTATKILSDYINEISSATKKSAGMSIGTQNQSLRDDIKKSVEIVESKEKKDTTPPMASKVSMKGVADEYQKAAEQLRNKVIKQESNGNPNAISYKKINGKKQPLAKGLMQVTDPTGREVHKKLGLQDPYDPFNPEQNKMIGTAYLAQQLKDFGGDVKLALAAYNYGPGALKRAIAEAGSTNWVRLKRALPEETRNYVQKILGDTLNG